MPPSSALHKRKSPALLSEKLLRIRLAVNESQGGILRRMGLDEEFQRDYVSKWERGIMEPPLHVLLAYADLANIFLEVLARDTLQLPEDLPLKEKGMGIPIHN